MVIKIESFAIVVFKKIQQTRTGPLKSAAAQFKVNKRQCYAIVCAICILKKHFFLSFKFDSFFLHEYVSWKNTLLIVTGHPPQTNLFILMLGKCILKAVESNAQCDNYFEILSAKLELAYKIVRSNFITFVMRD